MLVVLDRFEKLVLSSPPSYAWSDERFRVPKNAHLFISEKSKLLGGDSECTCNIGVQSPCTRMPQRWRIFLMRSWKPGLSHGTIEICVISSRCWSALYIRSMVEQISVVRLMIYIKLLFLMTLALSIKWSAKCIASSVCVGASTFSEKKDRPIRVK